MKTIISSSKAPAAIGPYSQAVRNGNTVYFSGQLGIDPATGNMVSGDIKAQAVQALKNLQVVLAEAGGTLDDIVKVTVFILDMAEFQDVNSVYSEVFNSNPPARSCFAVAGLPKGGRVEIEAIAVL